MTHSFLVELAAIVTLGIAAQWISWRIRLPSILVLLGVGLLAGPVLGLLDPDAIFGPSLQPLVSLAVALILFEGGLSLRLRDLREIGRGLTGLITVGVLIAGALNSAAARYILDLDVSLSLLVGALLTVTGPTVVLPLLRHVRPSGKVGNLAKWEGILNDPVGAILAVLVFEALVAGNMQQGIQALVSGMGETLMAGLGLGLGAAAFLVLLLRLRWVPEFLESPFTLALVLGVFGASDMIQSDSGLLTVTVFGIVMANQRWVAVTHIVEFKENLRVLLISTLFVLLAARLQPSSLRLLDARVIAFVAALVLVIRPLTVLASTIGSGLTWREKAFLAWIAPRGIVAAAVSSVFALRLREAGYPGSEILVPVVFTVIMATVVIYGLTTGWVARRLGVSGDTPRGHLFLGAHAWAVGLARSLGELGIQVVLVDKNPLHVEAARGEGLEAYLGDVLDENLLDRLPLEKLGSLYALTPNPEVNLLASHRFARAFGRNRIFRIASGPPETGLAKPLGAASSPHVLFGSTVSYEEIESRWNHGARFRRISVPANENPAASLTGLGPGAVVLFTYSGVALRAQAANSVPEFKPGESVVVLVDGDGEVPPSLGTRA